MANTILSLSIIWCQAKIDRLTPPTESAHIQPPHLKVPLHHTSAEALAEALRPWLQRLQERSASERNGTFWGEGIWEAVGCACNLSQDSIFQYLVVLGRIC